MLALIAAATTLSCSRAAGRSTSTETSSGRCPPFLSQLTSLPEVVVLPEPCSPAMSTTVGGCEANFSLAVSLPRVSTSSSRTILMTCSPGESAVRTSWPMALAWMRSMRSLTTLKLTSASSSARRICFIASAMFSSVRTACPRRDLKARWSFSWRFSNIRDQHYFNRREDGRRPELSAASHQPSGSSLLFRKHFPCCDHRVAVNGQRVFHIPRVAAGEGDHHGDAASLGDAEDKFVTLLQSVHGERQAPELVFAIGIGSGDVAE